MKAKAISKQKILFFIWIITEFSIVPTYQNKEFATQDKFNTQNEHRNSDHISSK